MKADDRKHLRALERALVQAGLRNPSLSYDSVIASASPNWLENRRVYEEANKRMLALGKQGKLRECFHVTGEMRALSDPFHRFVLRSVAGRAKTKFSMIYHIPLVYRSSGHSVVRWNVRNWGKKAGWKDHIAAYELIARGRVHVYAMKDMAPIQFSVFGDDYVLMQEKHPLRKHQKRVWLLRSGSAHDFLMERAGNLAGVATVMDPELFDEFTSSVSGLDALELLYKLRHDGRTSVRNLSALVRQSAALDSLLSNLEVIGLIRKLRGDIELSRAGGDYLDLLSGPKSRKGQ